MLIEDIAKHLDGLGYGNYFDTGYDETNNIFLNNMPKNPDSIIAIYDTGGEGKDIGFTEIKRNVQIVVRNDGFSNGNYLSWAIFNALTTSNTNGYLKIDSRKMLIKGRPPIAIGKDNNGLFEWSINFEIWTKDDITI